MKNSFLFLVFITLIHIAAFTQPTGSDTRTLTTKIADILARFPVQNSYQQNNSMQQIAELGENGLSQMVMMWAARGKGNNTALEYALSGFTSFVSQAGKETLRARTVRTFCTALPKLPDDNGKNFIIQQLEIIGKDDAVSCLQPYLRNETLAGAASRALAQINTVSAEKILLNALRNSSGKIRLSLVEALGYSRYKPALAEITKFAGTTDKDLVKVALNALAVTGDPVSATVLEKAADGAGLRGEITGATGAYLTYLSQLLRSGNKTLAMAKAEKLLQKANTTEQVPVKSAALHIISQAKGTASLSDLTKAMAHENAAYRAVALQLAEGLRNSSSDRAWLGTLEKVSSPAKAQIIRFLGQSSDPVVTDRIINLAGSDDKLVRLAAIESSGIHGREKAIPALMAALSKSDKDETSLIKNTLLTIPLSSEQTLLSHYRSLPATSQAAILEVLSERKMTGSADLVLSQIKSGDPIVKKAALNALAGVVTRAKLNAVFSLAGSAGEEDVPAIRKAMTAATSGITDTAERTRVVLSGMANMPPGSRAAFFGTLADIGGTAAFNAVKTAYSGADASTGKAIVQAMASSSWPQAPDMLLTIAKNKTMTDVASAALEGYIARIERGAIPAQQKVIMLYNAMELADTEILRKRIIRAAASNRIFSALVFAGNHIDDPSLQSEAANAVMRIALSDKNINGKLVRELLTRAMDKLKGQDAIYEIQAIKKHLDEMPDEEGYVQVFNGRDLSGWKGLVENPVKRASMHPDTLKTRQARADQIMRQGWKAENGQLIFTGHGDNLVTEKQYGDFEMLVDWKITKDGDAGIYLRGTPQVQIWDTSRRDVGAQVGSGGLYNNEKNPSKPLTVADNPVGEWNNFHIIMKGDKVTVFLNGQLVTDQTVLENFWNRNNPIFPKEQIELQAHGTYVAYRNIFIRDIKQEPPYTLSDEERRDGFTMLFDGTNLDQWTGNKKDYVIEGREMVVKPGDGSGGNLFTSKEYGNFIFRFEFLLTPGANNGLGIRAPLEGNAAYAGMELQILDNDATVYKDLQPYQYHGSVYGVIPAKRGYLKPPGEWNYQEVIVNGSKIKVILNNEVILEGDIEKASVKGTMDKQSHPGLKRTKGHIGFLGHGSVVRFRNIRIKSLD